MNKKLDPFQSAVALLIEFALAGKLGSFDPTDLKRLQSAKGDMAAAQADSTVEEAGGKNEKPADESASKTPPKTTVSQASADDPKPPIVASVPK